jgi:hypothetical protein
MAARAGMSDIITRIRILIQDEDATPSLDDDTIQSVCDAHSQRVLQHELKQGNNDGTVWYAFAGHWEGDSNAPVLKDEDDTTLTHTADLERGFFTLDTAKTTGYITLSGYTYDVYAAAAECCDLLIASIWKEYSYSANTGSFQPTQRVNTLRELRESYRMARRIAPITDREVE